jgi:hypothetical protein
MSVNSASAASSRDAIAPAPASWPGRRGTLLLALAAQLIIISTLVSADPVAATWSSPPRRSRPPRLPPLRLSPRFESAGWRQPRWWGVMAMVGRATRAGLFFVVALVMLNIGGTRLWRDQP